MNAMHKILVANRGEIAVRVMRTARDLGYRTVAVYSDADADAPHVEYADEAVNIGPAGVAESYLRGDNILAAIQCSGADAVHPGYGFLSENTEFASQCEAAGVTFIGPNAEAINLMGSKRLSKLAMIAAGVPCIPGYQGAEQSDDVLLAEAQKIGFPIMVKASAGGGGRGMRLVYQAEELAEQIPMARSEAEGAFGSGELILEKAVLAPRHIEIQVFADNHGNTVYLGERDCSIQRRHQKVVEEAPSPFVDGALRQRMGEAAVNAAKACEYRGAGTVEFLVDEDKQFYFLEMNTRLQVEHPVTEMICGEDLVAWQIKVASGEPLPLSQDQISCTGHAVEVRLYAEDPRQQFLPQTGEIHHWQVPQRAGIRLDGGIQSGQQVRPHYDPMLAKLIAYGDNRQEAIRRLASALQDSQLLGVNNNKLFLQNILRHPEFIAGRATTAFIEQHLQGDTSLGQITPSTATLAHGALLFYMTSQKSAAHAGHSGLSCKWHHSSEPSYHYCLGFHSEQYRVFIKQQAEGHYCIDLDGISHQIETVKLNDNELVMIADGLRQRLGFARCGDDLYVDDGTGHWHLQDLTQQPASNQATVSNGQIKASMDGAIVALQVSAGDQVAAGQTLVVLEAMKMEHPLKAAISGVVESTHCEVGQQVKSKQLLVTVSDSECSRQSKG